MSEKYTLKLPAETITKAKEHGLYPLCVADTVESQFDGKGIPDSIGIYIGHTDKDTDELKSSIKDDEDASKLRKYIDAGLTVTKIYSQMTADKELKNVPYYFITYDVMESSKQEPTYTEDSCGYGTPINGHYRCRYEVLLGSEEYTRRMVFEEITVNISMYDWMTSLCDMIEDGIEDRDEEIMQHFSEGTDGETYFTMYDEVGSGVEVEFDRSEFESMIVSVRQLSCEFVEKKNNTERRALI